MVSKARIRLSSTDPQDINTICAEIKEIADKTGVKLKGPIPLPTKKLMVPTRKSPATFLMFIQYERRRLPTRSPLGLEVSGQGLAW